MHEASSRVDQFTNSEVHESTNPRAFTNPDGCSRVFTNSRIHESTDVHESTGVHECTCAQQGHSSVMACCVSCFVRDTCQEKMIRIRFLLHIVFRARYAPKKNDTYEFHDSKNRPKYDF